jgi:hypothetical protein
MATSSHLPEAVAQFLFIVAVPVVLVVGGLVTLFAVGALFDALDHPAEIGARIEALFKRPPKAPKPPGEDHYYRAYWAKP